MPRKKGQDTFDPAYCEQLINHMERGKSFASFAGAIGVTFKTLYNWEKTYPEFLQAKEIGRAKGLNFDESVLTDGVLGKIRGYNIAAHKWKMANMYKWTERAEVTEKSVSGKPLKELIEDAKLVLASAESELLGGQE